ncbi:MAG: bifunctional hydroxymethylpyrimidine kinase/phosphomethylpyrimidine kinase [Candidatus Methylomirabilales bacterium]
MPRAMTIAGSDSGGGAGIQADLKTFAAFGVYGTSAITAITAQNTLGVTAVYELPPGMVAAQIDAIVNDIGVDAAKTGMLADASIIEIVAEKIKEHGIEKLVVDPVMVAKSGDPLLRPEAVQVLKEKLLPLAYVITPNLPEAEVLVGRKLKDEEEIQEVAKEIHQMGPKFVVIKGGHRRGDAIDLLFDGQMFQMFHAERIKTPHTHGTGCTFAAGLAACLAKGMTTAKAVAAVKAYITEALKQAYPVGGGRSPVHHFYRFWQGDDG